MSNLKNKNATRSSFLEPQQPRIKKRHRSPNIDELNNKRSRPSSIPINDVEMNEISLKLKNTIMYDNDYTLDEALELFPLWVNPPYDVDYRNN